MKQKFNKKQLELISTVRAEFKAFKQECKNNLDAIDGWERDQWYTFNRSGLFEANDEENLSGITNWHQNDTRRYITEN